MKLSTYKWLPFWCNVICQQGYQWQKSWSSNMGNICTKIWGKDLGKVRRINHSDITNSPSLHSATSDGWMKWNWRQTCVAGSFDKEWPTLPAGSPAASSAWRISAARRNPSSDRFRKIPMGNSIYEASQKHRPGTANRRWLDYLTFVT